MFEVTKFSLQEIRNIRLALCEKQKQGENFRKGKFPESGDCRSWRVSSPENQVKFPCFTECICVAECLKIAVL